MKRNNLILLFTVIVLSGCACFGCRKGNGSETELIQADSSETVAVDAADVGDFLDMTFSEIESLGRIKELSYFRDGGSPVYSLTEYDGVYLVFPSVNDISSAEAVKNETMDRKPVKLLSEDSSVELFGLYAGMSAEDVKKIAAEWDDIYMSSENSLYYTSFSRGSQKITAAWAIPEEIFSEWCGGLSDKDDYYAEFLDFIKPFRYEPVGSIVELSLENMIK